MRVFLAGATGAIGTPPRPATRGGRPQRRRNHPQPVEVRQRWPPSVAEPVQLDGLDAAAVGEAVAARRAGRDRAPDDRARPASSICAASTAPSPRPTGCARVGTDNLLAAARASGRAAVRGAELHRLAQRAQRRPGQDRGRPARRRPAEGAAADARRDRARRTGRVGRAAGGRRPALRHVLRSRAAGTTCSNSCAAGGCRSSATGPGSGRSSTSTMPPRRPSPRSTAATGIYNIVDDDPAPVADVLTTLADIIGAKPAAPRAGLAGAARGRRRRRLDDDPERAARPTRRPGANWTGRRAGRAGATGSAPGWRSPTGAGRG